MRSYYDTYELENLRRRVSDILRGRNWAAVDDDILVRIPNGKEVENRIYMHSKENSEDVLVDLIYETWYDKEIKQSRNRKTRIGRIIPLFPEAMIINENYEKYFDLETGKLLKSLKGMEETRLTAVPKPAMPRGESPLPAAPRQALPDKTASPRQTPPQPKIPEDTHAPADPNPNEKEDRRERIEEMLREISLQREEMRKQEMAKKFRGEEEERRRQLFDDIPAGEDIEAREAEKRLSAIFEKIRSDHPDEFTPKDMNEENEKNPVSPDNPAGTDAEEQRVYRLAVLNQILMGIRDSIRNQAKKKPDAIVNTYKARSINRILQEIREYYEGSGYDDLLTLVEEPEQDEHDGRITLTGMTYSDTEVLLERYIAIVRFIRSKST